MDDHDRMLRGSLYLARLRVDRLEGAWPTPNEMQERALRDARRSLAVAEERAREEGIEPWVMTPAEPVDGAERRARPENSAGSADATANSLGHKATEV